MILVMRLVVGSLALLIAVNAAAQIYRWTDEKGRVVYGNEPPSGTNPSVVQERINSYSGPPEVRRAPPASTPVTAAPLPAPPAAPPRPPARRGRPARGRPPPRPGRPHAPKHERSTR